MDVPRISQENPLVLASDSPRRKRLLNQLGLPFRAIPSSIDEERIGADPQEEVLILGIEKARSVQPEVEGAWVLGADTLVTSGEEEILLKPKDPEDACRMLRLLSGRSHRVFTGFCLLDPLGSPAHCEAVETEVQFKLLTEKEIQGYVRTGEPFGKAGAYGIQGLGAFMVESISGSYTSVVGLPVCALIKALLATGALETFPLPVA